MNYALWIVTLFALLASACADRKKTGRAVKIAGVRLTKITPLFLTVMALYALAITYIPPEWIQASLGRESGWRGFALALAAGSVAVMPGFVAFPLCAVLRTQGVPYGVLAVFSVALMNVGIATFPIEVRYLGWRVALVRNLIAAAVSILVGLIVALGFGEMVLW